MWFIDWLVTAVSVSVPLLLPGLKWASEWWNNRVMRSMFPKGRLLYFPYNGWAEGSRTTTLLLTWMKFSYNKTIIIWTLIGGHLRRSHCGQSVSSGSRGMTLQTGALGGPCPLPRSCCLEVTSSPPFWLPVSPPAENNRRRKRHMNHAVHWVKKGNT